MTSIILQQSLFGRGGLQPPDSDPLPLFATDVPTAKPIQVAHKICGKKYLNIFLDDQDFPNQSNKFDLICHNTTGGPIFCKRKHSAPSIDNIYPCFHSCYNKARHGDNFWKELDLTHFDTAVCKHIYQLIQKYWSMFNNKGQFIPVKDYKCFINTGSTHPICIKNINYGPQETPTMQKCIPSLEKLSHICQTHRGKWFFKAPLAPKPNQEHVRHIYDFVWCFCVTFIPLNQITYPVAYPILCCDSTVHLSFHDGRWLWMWDAPQGYH